jgi:hypothetical protein
MPDDDDPTTTNPEMFTRAQVRAMIASEVQKVRKSFADYDELKAQAAEADKSKSAIERIEAKLDEATKRADKAEEANLRREVADELGLTARQARRLSGKTRDELLADGREYIEDNGITPKTKGTADDGRKKDDDGDGRQTAEPETDADKDSEPAPRRARQRPTETLHNGAPVTTGRAEEQDPLKLIENVRRF